MKDGSEGERQVVWERVSQFIWLEHETPAGG